jgi:hypothetical protein
LFWVSLSRLSFIRPFDAVSQRPYNFSVNTPIKESGCTTLDFEREELGAVRAWALGCSLVGKVAIR